MGKLQDNYGHLLQCTFLFNSAYLDQPISNIYIYIYIYFYTVYQNTGIEKTHNSDVRMNYSTRNMLQTIAVQ